jgi:hypothetical protein
MDREEDSPRHGLATSRGGQPNGTMTRGHSTVFAARRTETSPDLDLEQFAAVMRSIGESAR